MMNTPRPSAPPGSARVVRAERWEKRLFYASPCRFFMDVPLDMTGCLLAAIKEVESLGLIRPRGLGVFVTDSLYRGATLVEIEDPGTTLNNVVEVTADLLARDLPVKAARLRGELDELVRWSLEIGHSVGGVYVEYQPSESVPGAFRPAIIYAEIAPVET